MKTLYNKADIFSVIKEFNNDNQQDLLALTSVTHFEEGNSLLHYAIMEDSISAVQFLLSNGLNVNHINDFGTNPLHLAVYHGNLAIVKLLIESGAEINSDYFFDFQTSLQIYDDCECDHEECFIQDIKDFSNYWKKN